MRPAKMFPQWLDSMKSSFTIIILLTIISCSPKRDHQIDSGSTDNFIESKIKESGIVGLGAAIIVDKNLIWTKGYGFADVENKVLFTPNTIMNIASISKTIVGTCLMKAVETNKLSLDEDINTYLPFKVINPYYPKEKITLRQLATHTSSIVDQNPLYGTTYHFGGDAPEPLGKFLKDYFSLNGKYYKKENFLEARPGSRREYSNIAAGLTGYIIEMATGEQLNRYSKQYIFDLLKMDNTGWFLSEIKLENHSKLYYRENDSIKSYELYGLITYPDGGVRTSVTDLSKFFTCLLNGGEIDGVRILKEESIQEIFRPQFPTSIKPDNMDFGKENSGIFLFMQENGMKVGHTGGDPGVRTFMHYDTAKQVGLILFVNTGLDQEGMKTVTLISDELWRYALTIKQGQAISR